MDGPHRLYQAKLLREVLIDNEKEHNALSRMRPHGQVDCAEPGKVGNIKHKQPY